MIKSTILLGLFLLAGCNGFNESSIGTTMPDYDEESLDIFDNGGIGVSGNLSPTSGGWSATGLLNRLTNDETISLQVNFTESGPYTIQFSLDRGTGAGTESNAVAEIDWKVEGNWVHRAITLGDGATISGTAEAVRVSIFNVIAGGAAGEYRVSCQVAKGTRPNIQQPPQFVPVIGPTTIPATKTVDLAIPPNIGAISTYLTIVDSFGIPVAPGEVTIAQFGGTTLKAYDYTSRNDWVPLSPGSRLIRITNWTNGVGARIFFAYLTLGIDG